MAYIHHSHSTCPDCGEKHRVGNSEECIELLKQDRDRLSRERTMVANERNELQADFSALCRKYDIAVQALEEIAVEQTHPMYGCDYCDGLKHYDSCPIITARLALDQINEKEKA